MCNIFQYLWVTNTSVFLENCFYIPVDEQNVMNVVHL